MKRKKLVIMSIGIFMEFIAIIVITASESPAMGMSLLVLGLFLLILGFVMNPKKMNEPEK